MRHPVARCRGYCYTEIIDGALFFVFAVVAVPDASVLGVR